MTSLRDILRSTPQVRMWLCAAFLIPVFLTVHCAAYWLRFEGQLGQRELFQLDHTIVFVIIVKLFVFGWFRVYPGWGRFLTFHDLVTIVQAATVSSLVLAVGNYLFFPGLKVPRSVFLMDWGATIFVIGALRSVSRLVEEFGLAFLAPSGSTPVLIVGANDSGEALLRVIRRQRCVPYRVVGFVTESDALTRSHFAGVPVLGTLQETCDLAQQHRVKEVLIAAEELTGKQVRELIEDSQRHDISVKVLPSYQQLLHGKVNLRPRTVSIEDLLRRKPVSLDIHALHHWIDNRVLLVTGSAGSIGSEICRQLLQFRPRRLVLVDRSENGQFFLERELRSTVADCDLHVSLADVGDAARMENLIATHRPDIIFHAAAYKHVPLMEHNPGEALKNIVLMSKDLADLAHRYEVTSFVMISTDKAVNPTSVMGACKRAAELYVQSLAAISRCRFVTVRFGNVLDSAGSVVPIFRQQIASGGPVTVTHPDMTRFFMMIPEASQLVIQAGAMGHGGEIFVLDMGEPVRIVDLAEDMIRLSGLQVGDDVEIEFVGVRPGEKLYEELHVAEEKRSQTTHPKIMVAESEAREVNAISLQLERLRSRTESPPIDVITALQRIVPEFTPDTMLHRVPSRRAA